MSMYTDIICKLIIVHHAFTHWDYITIEQWLVGAHQPAAQHQGHCIHFHSIISQQLHVFVFLRDINDTALGVCVCAMYIL